MVNARTALSARQSSVAVACVLEGLNDAYAVARIQHDRRVSLIMAADSAPESTEPSSRRPRGGFGRERHRLRSTTTCRRSQER